MAAEPFALEALSAKLELSAEAEKELAWLRKTLGPMRISGPVLVKGGDYEVTLERSDGRHVWIYRRTPSAALAEARRLTIEDLPRDRRLS